MTKCATQSLAYWGIFLCWDLSRPGCSVVAVHFWLVLTCQGDPSITQAWPFSPLPAGRIGSMIQPQAWAEGEPLSSAMVVCVMGPHLPPQTPCLCAVVLFVLNTWCSTSIVHWIVAGSSWLCFGGSERAQYMESSSGFMVTWCPLVRHSIAIRAK